MTGIEKVIALVGGQKALADLCGVKEPAVSKWVKRRHAPQSRAIFISNRTGVPVHELVSPALQRLIEKAGK